MRPGRTGLLPPGSGLEDPDLSSQQDREEPSQLDLPVPPPGAPDDVTHVIIIMSHVNSINRQTK